MEKTLNEFVDEIMKEHPIWAMQTAMKLMELEQVAHWINLMWGVDLEIKVVSKEPQESRWVGKSVIEAVAAEKKNKK